MNIYVLGVNYSRTPLEIREKFSFAIDEHPATLKRFISLQSVDECSLLSTCNRTEIHFYGDFDQSGTGAIEQLWCDLRQLDLAEVKKYFYIYQGHKAVKHIFKVAAGMDSMILGEDQVLGQFKKAYEMALQAGTTSTILNTLSRQAITASKKMKTFIAEKKNDHSIASLVLDRLKTFYGEHLKDKTALVIGAGQIGTMVLKALYTQQMTKLYTTKRNACLQSCHHCLDTQAQIIDYEHRYLLIEKCDIVISATSSPHYTLTKDVLLEHLKDLDKHRFFIDLAVPRDFDEKIEELPNIDYMTIDDFRVDEDQLFVNGYINARYIGTELENSVLTYEKWYNFNKVVPVIQEIQEYAKEIVGKRMEGAMTPILTLDENNTQKIKSSTENALKTVINQFLYKAGDYIAPENLPDYFKGMKEAMENVLKKGE